MNNPIHSIHTPCKKCVFAKYDGITQTDCHISYLSKYRESNIEILEAYDDEKEFYIINDKKCVGYREDKWFDQFDLTDTSIETKIKTYFDNNKLHYLMVVNLKNFTIDLLNDLFTDLAKTKVPPQKIILVRYRDPSLSFNYDKIESIIKQHNISYPWRIQTMLDDSISYEEVLHNATAINTKYRFIVSVSEPTENISSIIDHANKVVHTDLNQFVVISNAKKTIIIYSAGVYRFGLIQEKQNILADDNNYTII